MSVTDEAWDRPLRRRREVADGAVARRRSTIRAAGARVSLGDAVEALILRRGWGTKTAANCRSYLLGSRFRRYLEEQGVDFLDQLTGEHAADFVGRYQALGASPNTIVKMRQYLHALEKFSATTPGYQSGLAGVGTIPKPKVPRKRSPVLTEVEERRLLKACTSERDRLIVEVFLASGLRVSELVALQLGDLHLSERPPYINVQRSAHNRRQTKDAEDRYVPLEWVGGNLAKRLERYIAEERPDTHRLEVFITSRRGRDGQFHSLTIDACEGIMARLAAETGIHCNPHKLRHTFCTRAAEAGVPIFALQDALGHETVQMVRHYYTSNRRAMLEAFARAHPH
jgi:integrase